MKIYFLLILYLLYFNVKSEEDVYFYTIDEVFEYIDSQSLDTDEYQEILDNLIKLFKNSYAFYDIAKNPPQPYEDYHSIVDIEQRLKEIDINDISKYEFYRRIASALSDLKDSHIRILFNDNVTDFGEFYLTSPFESFDIKPYEDEEGNEEPKIFISCLDDSILEDYFDDGVNLRRICDEYSDIIPIKTINGIDPFEYVANFGGDFFATKNPHGTFSYKIGGDNSFSLLDCLFDFTDEESQILKVVFDDDEEIETRYVFSSEKYIYEDDSDENFEGDNNYGRNLNSMNLKKKKFHKKYKKVRSKKLNAKEKLKKQRLINKIKNKKIQKTEKNKSNLRNLLYSWDFKSEEEIFKCRADYELDINIYYISSFTPKDKQNYIDVIKKCVELFDQNEFPILVINELNEGGSIPLSQLFMGILSPLIPINLYKGRLRMTETITKNPALINFLNENLTDINTCKNMTYESLIENQVTVNYSETNLSQMFYVSNASIYHEIEKIRLTMNNKRKPTEILILTDGYSFSAASLYIKYLQKMGGALVAGYFGHPYINDVFDSSQSPTPIFNSELLNIFSPEENKILFEKYYMDIEIPGIQTFFDIEDKNVPLEYEITPVDNRIEIYSQFDEDNNNNYLTFVSVANEYLELFNQNCSDNKKMIKISEECDSQFEDKHLHGGYICGEDGNWLDICVEVYCDLGYTLDKNKKKCVKDICSSIPIDDEEEEDKEEEIKEEEKEEENKEDSKEEESKEEESKEEEKKEEEKEEESKAEEEKEESKEEEEKEKEQKEESKEEEIKEEESKEEEKKEESKEEEQKDKEEEKEEEDEKKEKQNEEDNKNIQIVYYIVLSAIVLIVLLVIICLCCHYCRKKTSTSIEVKNELDKLEPLGPKQMI